MAENGKNQAGEKLLAAACEAYGINKKYVLASNYYPKTDEVAILTQGGTKIRYKKGDEKQEGFRKLTKIEVDGVIRKKMKPITGGKKK